MRRAITMAATVAILAAVCGMTWADGRGWGDRGDRHGRGDRDSNFSVGFYQLSTWVAPVYVAPAPVCPTYTYVAPEPVYVYQPVVVYQQVPVYQPAPVYRPVTVYPAGTYPGYQPRHYVPNSGITLRFSW